MLDDFAKYFMEYEWSMFWGDKANSTFVSL